MKAPKQEAAPAAPEAEEPAAEEAATEAAPETEEAAAEETAAEETTADALLEGKKQLSRIPCYQAMKVKPGGTGCRNT